VGWSIINFFFAFRGRINRKTFWIAYLTRMAIMLLIFFIENVIIRYIYPNVSSAAAVVLDVLILALQIMIWVVIASLPFIFIRRLHDMNLSGWWLLGFYAVLGLLTAVAIAANSVILISQFDSSIIFGSLLFCGFVPGSRGENKFGAEP
jgi:uncharacterized membrane protein YhaH (DUF805 family)